MDGHHSYKFEVLLDADSTKMLKQYLQLLIQRRFDQTTLIFNGLKSQWKLLAP